MCGRFVQVWDAQLGAYVMLLVPGWKDEQVILEDMRTQARLDRGYNVGPSDKVIAITAPGGTPRLEAPRWGFQISFQGESGQQVEREVFNTRIEEAFEKPLWRGLIGKSHALVPVQGFYEWTGPKSNRVPNYIQRADDKPMLLGCVTGMRAVGEGRQACVSIVTSGPNDFMRPIHDRMPVIVEESKVQDWLNPASLGAEGVLDLCQPAKAPLKSRVVSKDVNHSANTGPKLLVGELAQQKRLF